MGSRFETELINLYEAVSEEETFVLLLEDAVRITGKLSRDKRQEKHNHGKAYADPGDYVLVKDAVLDFPDGRTITLHELYVRYSAIVGWGTPPRQPR